MRIYVHRYNRTIVQAVDYDREVLTLRGKRRDRGDLEIVFTNGSTAQTLPSETTGGVTLKTKGVYTENPPLAEASSAGPWVPVMIDGIPVYRLNWNLGTAAITAKFSDENANLESIDCMFEIEWQESPTQNASTVTKNFTLENDVRYSGDDPPDATTAASLVGSVAIPEGAQEGAVTFPVEMSSAPIVVPGVVVPGGVGAIFAAVKGDAGTTGFGYILSAAAPAGCRLNYHARLATSV